MHKEYDNKKRALFEKYLQYRNKKVNILATRMGRGMICFQVIPYLGPEVLKDNYYKF